MSIEYSPQQDGSGVIVAPDGTRVGFTAGVTVKDMAAMQIACADAHPAPPDPAPMEALEQRLADLEAAVAALTQTVAAAKAAPPTVATTPPTT